MLAKRIIPCLDVRNGTVVKGIQFQHHRQVGDIVELASYYAEEGADELVFYDITASCENRSVLLDWVKQVARVIDIPFTVAGGIRSVAIVEQVLNAGADKISINSPALEQPMLIYDCSQRFGQQCVVVGIDSQWRDDDYYVYQYTGDVNKSTNSRRKTLDWLQMVQELGAGEIVLNCMHSDGMRSGYDVAQLQQMRAFCQVPLIASGGAGCLQHFAEVFQQAQVDGALAASVFHNKQLRIAEVKAQLMKQNILVRP